MSNSAGAKSVRKRAPVPKNKCPMALAAAIVGDKYTLLILREAFYGVTRFDDMRADLGAPRSTLTGRLAKLVELEILTRAPYQEDGSRWREAYALTEKGRALALTLLALAQWGEDYVLHGSAPVEIVDAKSGEALRVGLITVRGKRADLRDAVLTLRAAHPRKPGV